MAATVTKLVDNGTQVVFHVVSGNVGTAAVTDEVVIDVSALDGATSNTRLRVTNVRWSVSLPVLLEFDLTTDQVIWAMRTENDVSFPGGLSPSDSSGTGDVVITHAGVSGATYSILITGVKVENMFNV